MMKEKERKQMKDEKEGKKMYALSVFNKTKEKREERMKMKEKRG